MRSITEMLFYQKCVRIFNYASENMFRVSLDQNSLIKLMSKFVNLRFVDEQSMMISYIFVVET